jgi:hypothetical protein
MCTILTIYIKMLKNSKKLYFSQLIHNNLDIINNLNFYFTKKYLFINNKY